MLTCCCSGCSRTARRSSSCARRRCRLSRTSSSRPRCRPPQCGASRCILWTCRRCGAGSRRATSARSSLRCAAGAARGGLVARGVLQASSRLWKARRARRARARRRRARRRAARRRARRRPSREGGGRRVPRTRRRRCVRLCSCRVSPSRRARRSSRLDLQSTAHCGTRASSATLPQASRAALPLCASSRRQARRRRWRRHAPAPVPACSATL
mmetsp:Transcript_1528/g.4894  ORF Transcript_1528/g.4894 Transcript_1528/m.4894 type:complete len:213 (+) Transcript_1528:425-1063(+)